MKVRVNGHVKEEEYGRWTKKRRRKSKAVLMRLLVVVFIIHSFLVSFLCGMIVWDEF